MARPTLITVRGTYLKPDGTPDAGHVSFTSTTFVRHSVTDDVVTPGSLRATLDGAGDVTLQVPATNDPAWSPVGWLYRVTVYLSTGPVTFDAAIPYDAPGGILDLSELLPTPATSGALYAAYSHTHADLDMSALAFLPASSIDSSGATSAVAQLQAAITSAEEADIPGRVWIPPGTFLIDEPLIVTRPGLWLDGLGHLVAAPGLTDYMIKLQPDTGIRMDRVKITNLTLDCAAVANGIDALGASFCEFSFLEIKRHFDYALYLHGDNLGGFGHHNDVTRCRLHLGTDGSAVGGIGTAIRNQDSDENRFSYNTLESNGGGLNSAAHIFDSAGLNSYTFNKMVANPNVASVEFIKLTADTYTVVGNTFDGGTNAQLEVGGNDCSISDNKHYRPVGGNDCVLVTGQNNTFTSNTYVSAAGNGDSRHAINAGSASGTNYRWANVVRTNGSWAGAIYNGNGSQLAVATG